MKSFLEGRQVVSRTGAPANRASGHLPNLGQFVPSSSVPILNALSAPSQREHAEKKIETVELDGVVQRIIVTCGCGERIEVHCGY